MFDFQPDTIHTQQTHSKPTKDTGVICKPVTEMTEQTSLGAHKYVFKYKTYCEPVNKSTTGGTKPNIVVTPERKSPEKKFEQKTGKIIR